MFGLVGCNFIPVGLHPILHSLEGNEKHHGPMDQLTNGALQFSSPTPHRAATSLQQAPLLSCSPLQLLASVIVTGFVPSLVVVSSSSCSRRFTSGDHDVSNDTRTTETKSPKRRPSNPLQMPENVAKFKACNISVYECIYIYILLSYKQTSK